MIVTEYHDEYYSVFHNGNFLKRTKNQQNAQDYVLNLMVEHNIKRAVFNVDRSDDKDWLAGTVPCTFFIKKQDGTVTELDFQCKNPFSTMMHYRNVFPGCNVTFKERKEYAQK